MSTQENKALVRRYIEEVLGGDLTLLDEYVTKDYVDHCDWKNREGLRHTLAGFQAGFGELGFAVEDMIAEEDKVAARIRMVGTSKGAQKTITAIVIYRIAGGKIVEHWGHSDSFF